MQNILIVTLTLLVYNLYAQVPEISLKWQSKYVESQFDLLDIGEYFQYDYSKILSNQLRFEGDIWSTYVGVFGPKNRRIDFHLEVSKQSNDSYKVIGKSKLGSNIRNLNGTIKLIGAYKTTWMANILTFEYELNEPGDKEGDGKFIGIGAITFIIKDKIPDIFWAASGDFREYNNMFVGTWIRNNSNISRECIFTFMPSGTHNKLPFRDDLYKEFGEMDECKCYFEFKNEIRQYGWEDYDDDNRNKVAWWK
ncbi:hypothetical protein [Fulvivirga lutimaris]|uniref:hypothetical protein n=1 Tax=Fulvivirga lutimaris TaxID=1819566 RepID=UPI0012BB7D73|nr:hypothetical protein [Fulvivirga lutimaris]MTI39265.1 hypothetical protein [Fulvivirga lutimaris]